MSSPTGWRRWAVLRRSLRRALARHRRLLSAGCLAGAAAVTVHAVSPPPPPSVTVWVAARDLPAGHRLTPRDVAASRWPPSLLPAGGVARPAGAWLAGPIRRGEPVTDARLVGPGLLAGQPLGVVALAVRVSDPASLIGVRSGERVDVLAGPPGQGLDPAVSDAGAATTLASAALVLGALAGAVRSRTGLRRHRACSATSLQAPPRRPTRWGRPGCWSSRWTEPRLPGLPPRRAGCSRWR